MKTRKILHLVISLALLSSLALNLFSCVMTVKAENLMNGVTPNEVAALDELGEGNIAATDFALRLFRASYEDGDNTLISPLSVLSALAMTANGAEGDTLSQMETVFGMDREQLNLYLYSYVNSLSEGEKYKLRLANSIWFTDDGRFTAGEDFLQTNADYYGADIYKTPFNNQTLRDINSWVNQNTDGMIPKILDRIPEEAVMYLVNALSFEAEWSEIYKDYQVRNGHFTSADGERQSAKMMYCNESRYLEDDSAVGFIKLYKGSKYAFVALLPNEGVSISDYLATLDGESLSAMLESPRRVTVQTAIPRFEVEYDVEMSSILKNMGMTDAFDESLADLSSLGRHTDGNLYISRVLHKTYIKVGERGTRAGAATVVEVENESAAEPSEIKEVYLDRPFVYMLVDCENSLPFFIGTVNEL